MAATSDSGRGRSNSATTLLSFSHRRGGVIIRPRRRTTANSSHNGPKAAARRRVPPRSGARRLRATLGLGALLVVQAAIQPFHRHANLPGFAPKPGLVPGVDVVDGCVGSHAGASCSVGSPSTGLLQSNYAIRNRGAKPCRFRAPRTPILRVWPGTAGAPRNG